MAKQQVQTLLSRGRAASRRLCTASAAAVEDKLPVAELSSGATGGGEKERKSLYRRLSVLGGRPAGSVSKVLDKWTFEGRSVRAVNLMKYVKDLRKYRRHSHALEVMEWMSTRGMNMSYANHAVRLDLIAKTRGIEAAEEYFSNLPQPARNERTYGSLFGCYCSAKMTDKAIYLYNEMKEKDMTSGILVHNNLMSLYMKLGQPEKVVAHFEEMKTKNIVPDNFTCCIVMNSYALLNDIESVERIIQEAEEGGRVTLRWPTYSNLAAIYSSSGLIDKAECALKKLEGVIDSPDREPYHFLLSLYAGIGNLAEVHRVWKSLKSIFPKPFNLSYLTVLQALSKLDDINGLKQMYEEWESSHLSYDLRLTNVAIGAYLRHGMSGQAEALWERASQKGALCDSRTCDLFMVSYLNDHNTSLALKWLQIAAPMKDYKLTEDRIIMFLKSFEEANDAKGTQNFLKVVRMMNCLDEKVKEELLQDFESTDKKDSTVDQGIEDTDSKVTSKLKLLF